MSLEPALWTPEGMKMLDLSKKKSLLVMHSRGACCIPWMQGRWVHYSRVSMKHNTYLKPWLEGCKNTSKFSLWPMINSVAQREVLLVDGSRLASTSQYSQTLIRSSGIGRNISGKNCAIQWKSCSSYAKSHILRDIGTQVLIRVIFKRQRHKHVTRDNTLESTHMFNTCSRALISPSGTVKSCDCYNSQP